MSVCRLTLTSAALAIGLLPVSSNAQTLSWLDLIAPERLVEKALRYGVMGLRSVVGVSYGDLSTNLLSGQVTITDVRLWRLGETNPSIKCEAWIDRLNIAWTPFENNDHLRLKASASGVDIAATCLPSDLRPLLAAGGARNLAAQQIGFDIDYDIATAGALVRAHGALDNLAAFDLTADFSYLWIDGSRDIDNPEPLFHLSSAALGVENAGGWELISPLLPQAFTNPETAAPALADVLGSIIKEFNNQGETSFLTLNERAFIATATNSWGKFLQDPQRMVLETGIAPGTSVYLDFDKYERDPKRLFDDLDPRLVLIPARAKATLTAGFLTRALGSDSQSMSEGERLRAGIALTSGIGAPRDIPAGTRLLSELARSGNGAAALALSEVLETRQPEQAYGWSLRAGADGRRGATARLDRLETVLDMATVLRLQNEGAQGGDMTDEALASVSAIKAHALARLTGNGMARNYGMAVTWAILAAAAGDGQAAALLNDIDTRMRNAGPQAVEAWSHVEANASRRALDAWLTLDLPARFGNSR